MSRGGQQRPQRLQMHRMPLPIAALCVKSSSAPPSDTLSEILSSLGSTSFCAWTAEAVPA